MIHFREWRMTSDQLQEIQDKDKRGKIAHKITSSKWARGLIYASAFAMIPGGAIIGHLNGEYTPEHTADRSETTAGKSAETAYTSYVDRLDQAQQNLNTTDEDLTISIEQSDKDKERRLQTLSKRLEGTIENVMLDPTLTEAQFLSLQARITASPLFSTENALNPLNRQFASASSVHFVDCQNNTLKYLDNGNSRTHVANSVADCLDKSQNPEMVQTGKTFLGGLMGIGGAILYLMLLSQILDGPASRYEWRKRDIRQKKRHESGDTPLQKHMAKYYEEERLERTSRDKLDAWVSKAELKRPVISDEHNENLVDWLESPRAKLNAPKI